MSQASTQIPSKHVSIDDYLRLDEQSLERLEYYEGEIISMAGATMDHSRINSNLSREIGIRLRGTPCEPFGNDLKVGIPNLPSFSYPDFSVICGTPEMDPRDGRGTTVTNPRLVIEILSPSTEAYDRGRKFKRYMRLKSLQQYVLVSQEEPRVEIFLRRHDGTWVFSFVEGLDAIVSLGSLQIDIPLKEVYRNVVFPSQKEFEDRDS